MATTTNFGWETPDDTDLVKDGAAAIRTALGGVDTSFVDLKGGTTGQVLAKASNTDLDFVWSADAAGMTNPMTTTGDTIYSSSGSTPARLGIGTTGQVLTVAAGLPAWATPALGGDWTQAATGSMTGTSITINSLSGKRYFVMLKQWSHNTGASNRGTIVRLNGDSGSNYWSPANNAGLTSISPNLLSTDSTYAPSEGFFIDLAASNAAFKPIYGLHTASNNAGGMYNSTSAITSITIALDGSGSFDAGTYYVWSQS